MSDWDFLWGLSGEELDDAMSCGMTRRDMSYIQEQEEKRDKEKRNVKWQELKELRDSCQITKEEFKKRKQILFY